MSETLKDIWIIARQDGDFIEDSTFGLIAEARRIIMDTGGTGAVIAVIIGPLTDDALAELNRAALIKLSI